MSQTRSLDASLRTRLIFGADEAYAAGRYCGLYQIVRGAPRDYEARPLGFEMRGA